MKDSILIASVSWVLVAPFVFRHVPQDSSKSLSEHIAAKRLTVWVGGAALCLTALVVFAWYFNWYAVQHSNNAQSILLGVACLAAILLAITPYYVNTYKAKMHSLFAWIYAISLPPLVLTFMLTSESILAKVLILLLCVWQVVALGLFLFYRPSRKHFLYYQLSYISAFGLVVLVATYVGDGGG